MNAKVNQINNCNDPVSALESATRAIRFAPGVRGILVSSAKDAFIVGADIFEFTSLFELPENGIAARLALQNALFTAFEDLNIPSVTAINGLAFGSGFEMALASDARVIAQTGQVGLPEVSLGLFPGFGGTVRWPRLIGIAAAIEWICSGKPQSAEVALAAGAVNAVAAPGALRSAAVALRLENAASAAEIDMSLVLGLGFPRYAGGPLKYAHWFGFEHVVARCESYSSLGPLYTSSEGMRAAARSGRQPYSQMTHASWQGKQS